MKDLITKNKLFFSAMLLFILSFTSVMYLGVNRIYEKEAKLSHGIANTQLLSTKSVVEFFFSDLKHKLLFLQKISTFQAYVNTCFSSNTYKKDVSFLFQEMLRNTDSIFQINVFNDTGQMLLHVDKDLDHRELSSSDHDHLLPDHIKEAMKLDNNQISFFSIQHHEGDKPTIIAAIALYDTRNTKQGVLLLNVDLTNLFQLLPTNIAIQTPQGELITINENQININKSPYGSIFSDTGTRLSSQKISKMETIHYTNVQIAEGQHLAIIKVHHHAPLTVLLNQLIIVSGVVIFIFLCFIMVITYTTISRIQEKVKANKAMIDSLIMLTDWRDPETGEHLKRTRQYCVLMANQLKRSPKYKMITRQFIEDLHDAAPLHDIGKVGIKDSILLKPGKLTTEEFEEMKNHVNIGDKIISSIIDQLQTKSSLLDVALNVCAYHHERYDGSGYNKGLNGDKIPLEARIFALADVYDALRSKRPYKKEMPHSQAADIIKKEKGRHFDPDIVDAFIACENEFQAAENSITLSTFQDMGQATPHTS